MDDIYSIVERVILHQCLFGGNEYLRKLTSSEVRNLLIEPLQHYLNEHANKQSDHNVDVNEMVSTKT